ncbi:MAG: site-specific DNA-methyltransferase [Chloroflexota bacterium]
MAKRNYQDWSQEDLIKHIEKLEKRKKYGLVWDEERTQEEFELAAQNGLPVLQEVPANEIVTDPEQPTHILIEGDNYHALSVLNYTHEKAVDVIYIDPPYNTGAKDWKYNNSFVDAEDAYRHSKWISMMHKRLVLAKNVIKQDGVLIVTIDDHELFNLLGILEDLNATTLGRVAICIKPEGRRQSKFFMEAHEYAIFVTWGTPRMRGLNVDFGLDFPEVDELSKFRWEGLMRRDAAREDRGSEYWYPFYVSKDGKISVEKITGYEVWPINTKGIERVWLWDKDRARDNLNDLKAVIRQDKVTIYYKRREQGRVKPTSFWYGSKYNANAYGTRVLEKIVPKNNFDYPKSVYSVLDCIDIFLPKDGLVLDFFAGSGTTGHSAMLLNDADGGSRRFILCTNNENQIAETVTYPRVKNCIVGYKEGKTKIRYGGNLKYFRTSFVPAEPSDENKELLTRQSVEMLCLREGTFEFVTETDVWKIFENNQRYTAILFDQLSIPDLKEELETLDKPVSVYIFSLEDDNFANEFADMKEKVKVCSIPEAILRVYRRIYG